MAIALFSRPTLFQSVHALFGWLAHRTAPVPARAAAPRIAPPRPVKPLRVVRVLEPAASRSTAGRMVISGRLADVCAELDRLAALEAAAH